MQISFGQALKLGLALALTQVAVNIAVNLILQQLANAGLL